MMKVSKKVNRKRQVTGMWDEDNRPQTVADMVLPSRIKNIFKDVHKTGIEQNYLFYGSAGIGKTTLAKIIQNHYSLTEELDCSTDGGKSSFSNVFENFANLASFNHKQKKFILLEEVDGLSLSANKSAKKQIENSYATARVVATTNNPSGLLDATLSRFVPISFDLTKEDTSDCFLQIRDLLRKICKKYGYNLEDKAVIYLINNGRLNIRNMVKKLQVVSTAIGERKTITLEDVQDVKISENSNIYDFLTKLPKPEDLYIFFMRNYKGKEVEIINSMGSPFLKHLMDLKKYQSIPLVSQAVHKIQYESKGNADKFNSLIALCSTIVSILTKF